MVKSPARTFGQDLMRGEHLVGGDKTNGGVLMPSHTSGDPSFYAKKRAKEAELGHELTTEAFLANYYQASDAATASGTSIFDPVLCEIAYRWFCPQGGTVLDPFAGGSVRGIVASQLGRAYVGIELRAEQVAANQAQAALGAGPVPRWITGDSRDIATLAKGVDADLIFSCPPYWNLEVYSDDPADLSTLGKDAFFDAYARIIAGAMSRLREDRFTVWVIGDVRDAGGFFVNLPGKTVEAFEAAGARFYNDAILVTAVGSLPIRAGRQFEASRKLGRTHQNVLVFCKGDPKRATEAIGQVEFGEIDEADGTTEEAPQMNAPIVQTHSGIWVVRDDLHPGGTKARFIGRVFDGVQEAVYASPPEGGAQTALAHVARALGKKATIFVAQRANPHARTLEAARLGAKVVSVSPGYLTVVQSRARQYCRDTGASLIPFGADIPGAVEALAEAALATGLKPDEVWCAAGSGVLARGLALAWPNTRRHVVQIGRALAPKDVAGARNHVYPRAFGQVAIMGAPFPADLHYDAKAWEVCVAMRGPGRVLFWNVAPLPRP